MGASRVIARLDPPIYPSFQRYARVKRHCDVPQLQAILAFRRLRCGVRKMKRFGFLALAVLAGCSAARAQEPLPFQGKAVTMIIGSAPGGGTDLSGRLIANFIASRLPNNPNVIVRNIPGAQGLTAMNHFAKQVAPDGLTITMGSTTQADPLFYRKPTSQFDPTTFVMIGGAGRGGTVLMIRKDAEPRLYDKKAPPVIMGSLGGVPRSGMQTTAWGIAFLGWNAKWVVGYPGTNELLLALDRGEIDMTATGNLFQIRKLLATGRFKILSQSGTLKDGKLTSRAEFEGAPFVADMIKDKIKDPIAQQAFQYWTSITAIDKWVALPPGTPEPFARPYRDAYLFAFNDPDFAEAGKKISEDFEPMSHQDVTFLIQSLGKTSPEAIAFIAEMLKKQGLEGE
jgi:tripartite-type tricarboxylate transporter receptor subunit TctC